MINFYVIKENMKEQNTNWPQNHDNLYRILIIGGSGSEKNKFIIQFNKSATRYC